MINFKGLNATAAKLIFTHFGTYGREQITVVFGIGNFVIVTGCDMTGAAVSSGSCRRHVALVPGS